MQHKTMLLTRPRSCQLSCGQQGQGFHQGHPAHLHLDPLFDPHDQSLRQNGILWHRKPCSGMPICGTETRTYRGKKDDHEAWHPGWAVASRASYWPWSVFVPSLQNRWWVWWYPWACIRTALSIEFRMLYILYSVYTATYCKGIARCYEHRWCIRAARALDQNSLFQSGKREWNVSILSNCSDNW